MLLVLLQPDLFRQLIETAVHPGPDVTGFPGILEDLGVLSLPSPDHRGEDLDTAALGQIDDLVDDLVDGLLANLLAADGTVGRTHPGPEQAEVVVDLRHCTHSGPRVLAGGLLVNGDGGREAVDVVHIRLFHLAQEHPGIGAQALHVSPLALGINGIESQGGLARAGKSRHHHQLIPGNLHVHIFEVVLPRAFDIDFILHGCRLLLR